MSGTDPKESANRQLYAAAYLGDMTMAADALRKGADVNGGLKEVPSYYGDVPPNSPPLITATREGHADMVEYLLTNHARLRGNPSEEGAQQDLKANETYKELLLLAVRHNRPQVVSLLMKKPLVRETVEYALKTAALHNSVEALGAMIESKKVSVSDLEPLWGPQYTFQNPNSFRGSGGGYVYGEMARKKELFELLKASGSAPSKGDLAGAIFGEYAEGASDGNRYYSGGLSPELVDVMLKAGGADSKLPDHTIMTLMDRVVRKTSSDSAKRSSEMIKMLLENGFTDGINQLGGIRASLHSTRTALDLAQGSWDGVKHHALSEILKRNGAKTFDQLCAEPDGATPKAR